MKPMTLAEQILAAKTGRAQVSPGEMLWCKIDRLFTHDPCSPGVFGIFAREFGPEWPIFDPDRYAILPDHFIFTADPLANANLVAMREFAKAKGVTRYYDPYGPEAKGVCHLALVETGMVRPGELLAGTDSHTVTAGAFGCMGIGVGNSDAAFALGTGELYLKVPASIQVQVEGALPPQVGAKDLVLHLLGILGVQGASYRVLEFSGATMAAMSAEERMTIANMSVEAGAKAGLMAPNQAALDYLARFGVTGVKGFAPHPKAEYERSIRINAEDLRPMVAMPHSPDKVVPVAKVAGTKIDQVYLGSCTGGKLEDFLAFARVVQGKQVKVLTHAVPGTRAVAEALAQTMIQGQSLSHILLAAGVRLSPFAGCGACCGGPEDTFGRVGLPVNVLSTTNRNFPGRMGHKEARIHLASPLTAAATALRGHITNPEEVMEQA